jgi:hypothetical protein
MKSEHHESFQYTAKDIGVIIDRHEKRGCALATVSQTVEWLDLHSVDV